MAGPFYYSVPGADEVFEVNPFVNVDATFTEKVDFQKDITVVTINGSAMPTDGSGIVTNTVLAVHTADPSAHHIRYTDLEAVTAMGVKANSNPLNHDRYTDAEAQAVADTQIATHTAIADAHHTRYTDAEAQAVADTQIATHTAIASAHHTRYLDSEAVTAMGVKADLNPLNHDRYTDAEAQAVADTQIATHTAIVDAHHTRYTDGEAYNVAYPIASQLVTLHNTLTSSHGGTGDSNPLNHNRYTDLEAQAVADTQIATHTAIAAAHHTRYIDSEAVTAMGVKGDTNPLNHDRYTDLEAQTVADTRIATHTAIASAHHTRYADSEAAAQVTYENLSANSDVGTGATQVSQGDHTHGGGGGTAIDHANLTNVTADQHHAHANKAQIDLVTDGDHDVRTDNPHTVTTTQIGAIPATEKAAANGVATLDGGGKIPTAQIPTAVLGQVEYIGTWDATANTPTLSNSGGGPVGTKKGDYYVVSTAGTTSIDGVSDWEISDWIVNNGTIWQKVDNTDQVVSVAGKKGIVTLIATDVTDFQTAVSANTDVTGNTSARHTQGTDLGLDTGGANPITAATAKGHVDDVTTNPHAVTAVQTGAIPTTEKGAANGVATLDAGTTIPDAQIPAGIARDSEVTTAISNHTAISDAHHAKYTNAEAATQVTYANMNANGDVGTGAAQVAQGDHLHTGVYEPADAAIMKEGENVSLLNNDADYQSGSDVDTTVATHTAIAGAHHTRYLDSEAVTAMGVKGDSNPLNHDRYTDAEAAAEVTYGNLNTNGDVGTGATQVAQGDHNHSAGSAVDHDDLSNVTVDQHHNQFHKGNHIHGNSDEIDGDKLDIDYVPTNYTRDTTPPEVTSVEELTAHLAGLDNAYVAGKPLISITGGGKDRSYFQTGSQSWVIARRFRFPGSVLMPTATTAEFLVYSKDAGKTSKYQIYDLTNAVVICTITTTSASPVIITISLSNIPTAEALWEVQVMKAATNGADPRFEYLEVR